MNSEKPELCLAEEFGRFFVGWNGRPLVMNHPVVNGTPVCANQPEILEEYQIGIVFNASVPGKKLVVEAWVDNERASSLNDASAEALARMQAGDIVEVSTGLYTGVEDQEGTYNGEQYFGVWRDIVPDHLAILESGLVGACSIADGCGTNRMNTMAKRVNSVNDAWRVFSKSQALIKPNADDAAGTAGTTDCECKKKKMAASKDPNSNNAPTGEELLAPTAVSSEEILANLRACMIPDGMLTSDAAQLVATQLRATLGEETDGWFYTYVLGMTADKVVYMIYSDEESSTYQRSFSIASDGSSVTLGSDIEAVNLITKIVPRANDSGASEDATRANEENEVMKNLGTVEQLAANAEAAQTTTTTTTTATPPVAPAVNTVTGGDTAGAEQVAGAVAAGGATGKAHSVESLLANVSPELRESIEEGQRVLRAKKNDLIGKLKASGRCKIADERLNSMKVLELEELCELAAIPNYAGLAPAVDPSNNTQRDNSQKVPTPPAIFEIGAAFKNNAA
jgi:hypothetical protein